MELIRLSGRRLAAEAQISTNTVGRFLSGQSWPRRAQLAAIEEALDWPTGSIESIADGGDVPDIRRSDEIAADRVADRDPRITVGDTLIDPEDQIALVFTPGFLVGLSPEDRDEAITRAKLAVQEFVRGLKTRA